MASEAYDFHYLQLAAGLVCIVLVHPILSSAIHHVIVNECHADYNLTCIAKLNNYVYLLTYIPYEISCLLV